VSVRAALSQVAATSEGEKRAAAQAAVAREAALKDAEAAQDRCRVLEAELKILREDSHGRKVEEEMMKAREDTVKGRDAELEQLAQAQATERDRLQKLEKKVEAEKVQLEIKANVLAEDRECRCQNRRISGRGSQTVRLGSMVTGDGGHDVYPGSGPLDGGKTLRPA